MKKFLKKLFTRPIEYHPAVVMRTHDVPTTTQHLYKGCKLLLSENGIRIHKIKFVYEKSFIYDIDNNVINPEYKVIIPIKKKHPTIEIGKPENTMEVFLGEYNTPNNFNILKDMIRNTKRGIAFLVHKDINDVMWMANLDAAANHYNNYGEDFDYIS